MSRFIGLVCGIRQGGVLSPYFFPVYIDSVVEKIIKSNLGCYTKVGICMIILLYADDILLIAPSVTSLQQLVNICEQELEWLDMSLNGMQKSRHAFALVLVSMLTVVIL